MFYAIQVKTGKEKQVCEMLKWKLRQPESDSIRRKINRVIAPVLIVHKFTKEGMKKIEERIFPGYIIISVAQLSPEVWYFIKSFKAQGVVRILDEKPVTKEEFAKNKAKFKTIISFEAENRFEEIKKIREKVKEIREKVKKNKILLLIPLQTFTKILKKVFRVYGSFEIEKMSVDILLQKMAFVL